MARIHKRGRGRGRGDGHHPNISDGSSRKTFYREGKGDGGGHSGQGKASNPSHRGRGGEGRGGSRGGENRENRLDHPPPYHNHQVHGTKANNNHRNAPRYNVDPLNAQLDYIIHAGKVSIDLDAQEEDDVERLVVNKTVLMTATINLATHLLHCQDKLQNCRCTTLNEIPTTPRTPLNAMADHIDINSFLGYIKMAVDKGDQQMIRGALQLEPPRDEDYAILQEELVQKYPPSGKGRPNAKLKKKCQDILQQGQPHPWQNLPDVILAYLEFLRREKEEQLTIKEIQSDVDGILRQCVLALSDTSYGVLILPFTLGVAKILTRISVGLDKNPEIVAQPKRTGNGTDEWKKTVSVEDCANLIRDAFIKCLADKTGTSGSQGVGRRSQPENKRTGIYSAANMCLKLLLQCGKLRNAEMMFTSIDAQSPSLSFYPASQRVSFLYFLGRYHFANNHFFRAQAVLQAAYDQCHIHALKHRRLILTYLIASNICSGRFPSAVLLSRAEIASQTSIWATLCGTISRGDIGEIRKYLSLDSNAGKWFLRKHLLLQLQNRCEVLVWRSLIRRTFIVAGYHGGEDKTVPFLRLKEVQAAAAWLESRHITRQDVNTRHPSMFLDQERPFSSSPGQDGNLLFHTDDDFHDIDNAIAETGLDIDQGIHLGEEQPYENRHAQSIKNGTPYSLDIGETESIVCSLINQGLLRGFVTHSNPRFAIPGAKSRGPLATGFPNIWRQVLSASSNEIPGWVKDSA